MLRFVPILSLSVAIAVLAAGCGGGQSAEEKYANSVCTHIGTWKDQVQKSVEDVSTAVQSPSAGTVSTISTAVQSAGSATRKLASDLKSEPAPNTDEGAKAKQELEMLASELESTVTNAKQALNSLPQNPSLSQITSKLAPLAGSLQSLAAKTSSTIDSVKSAGSKMKDGFDKASACKKLH